MVDWEPIIDDKLAASEAVHKVEDYRGPSQLQPGATEEQLLDAEKRLGTRLPSQYRELLTVTNGWTFHTSGHSLMSTQRLGDGVWSPGNTVIEAYGDREPAEYETWRWHLDVRDAYWEMTPPTGIHERRHGGLADWRYLYPISWNDNSMETLFAVAQRPGESEPTERLFYIQSGGELMFPTLVHYLQWCTQDDWEYLDYLKTRDD